jgi:hypothetical protein
MFGFSPVGYLVAAGVKWRAKDFLNKFYPNNRILNPGRIVSFDRSWICSGICQNA